MLFLMRYGIKRFTFGEDLQHLARKASIRNIILLDGKARAAIVVMDLEELNKADDVGKVLKELDKSYLMEKLQLLYEPYDERTQNTTRYMSIAEYVAESERVYGGAKSCIMTLRDGILAYKFLNNAPVSHSNEKLRRAI